MKKLMKFIVILLALASLIGIVASCGSTPTAIPEPTQVAVVNTPLPAPTSTVVEVAEPTITPEVDAAASSTAPSAEELAEEGFALPEIPRITCEELKLMMDEGEDFTLVDSRSKQWGYDMGHLPGAISIPNEPEPPYSEEWMMSQLQGLPEDELIILYCD